MSRMSLVVTLRWVPSGSVHSRTTVGFSYSSARRGSISMHSRSGFTLPWIGSGTSLAMRSPSAKGSPMTRTTSRITERAFSEPKVMICPTFSLPYLPAT